MIMHDWNDTKHDAILLIHPMLSSADDMKTFIANNLGDEYRYLAPDLAAHGDALEATYRSAVHEAEEIRSYLTSHDASNLKLGFGASLGGVVLLHLLKYDDIHFEHLFFEGTSFFTNAKMLYRIVLSQLLKKHGKAQSDPELCRRKMVDAFGESAAPKLAKHFIGMDEESIRCIAHDCSFVELPTLSESAQRICTFAYGDKDFDRKKALKTIPRVYPHATTKLWPGCGHCEKLSRDPKGYSKMLGELIQS